MNTMTVQRAQMINETRRSTCSQPRFMRALLALLLATLSCTANAQYNCWGLFYNDSGPGDQGNRICTNLLPKVSPWSYGLFLNTCNECDDGWTYAHCVANNGTVPGGWNQCTTPSYCQGATGTVTESNMSSLAATIIQIMYDLPVRNSPCAYNTSEGPWGANVNLGCRTAGPDTYDSSFPRILINTSKLITHTSTVAPPLCPTGDQVRHHVGGANRTVTVQCPLGTVDSCVTCNVGGHSYCVQSTDNTCPVNNPVKPGTGAKVLVETDFAFVSNSRLGFARTYNSFSTYIPMSAIHQTGLSNSIGGMFGQHWRSNFDRRLYPVVWAGATSIASVQRPDGSVQYFRLNGLEALPRPGSPPARLKKLATTCPTDLTQACWEYRAGSGTEIERYNANGLLIEIADSVASQHSVALNYDSLSRLTSAVETNTGRSLTFAYGLLNNKPNKYSVTSATAPDGTTISFRYDDFERLVAVDYPPLTSGGPVTTRTYHYEDTQSANSWVLLTGITDERGVRFATYAYDVHGRVISTEKAGASPGSVVNRHTYSYQLSSSNTFGTDGTNYTTTVTDPLNTQRIYTIERWRDSLRLKSVSQPCPTCGIGNTQNLTYDANGYIDVETDFRGTTKNRDHDAFGREISRIEADTTTVPPNSTPPEQRTVETDWLTSVTYPLSDMNRPVERRVRNASGTIEGTTRWVYNARGQVAAYCTVDPTDSTALAYVCGSSNDAPGGVRQWKYTYCESSDVSLPGSTCPRLGLVKTVDGPRGSTSSDITTYAYRAADDSTCATGGACAYRKGDLHTVTNPLNQTTTYASYDKAGRVTRITDANSIHTDFSYYPRGWLKTRKVVGASPSEDAITTITYDAVGNITRVEQPDGSYLDYVYDPALRLTDIVDNLGNRITYTLDAAGNRTKEQVKDSGGVVKRVLARQIDALGRIQSLVNAPYANQSNLNDPSVKKTQYSYDANGNIDLTTYPDPVPNPQMDSDHDPLNRLIKTIQDVGGIAAQSNYQYDARDNLKQITDPKGLNTTYTYDGLGDLRQQSSPDTGLTTFDYTIAGNLSKRTDARGVLVLHSHDLLNRPTGFSYPTSALNVAYFYDTLNTSDCNGTPGTFPIGRMTRMTDGSGETRWCYDRRGNVIKKVQVVDGISLSTQWTYTKADRVSAMTYPSGMVVTLTLDTLARTTALSHQPNAGGTSTSLISSVSYYPFGSARTITYGDGKVVTKEQDQNYWPDYVSSTRVGGVVLDFTLDAAGNVLSTAPSVGGSANATYGYDKLYRLQSVSGAGAPAQSFTYDATGNRLSKSFSGSSTAYAYSSGSHRLLNAEGGGVDRAYDAAGNTLTLPGSYRSYPSFIYGDHGRRVQADFNGVPQHYSRYNGRGERVRTQKGGINPGNTIRYYVYDEGGLLLGEYDNAGNRINEYVYLSGMLIAKVSGTGGGTISYVETDHLGTPRAIFSTGGTKTWEWTFTGSAFGEHAANDDVDGNGIEEDFSLRLPGQYEDAGIGYESTPIYYNYFRDYEPRTGRYIESDPMGLHVGPATYSYASARPLNATDPLGLFSIDESCKHCSKYDDYDEDRIRGNAKRACVEASMRIRNAELAKCIQQRCDTDGVITCDRNPNSNYCPRNVQGYTPQFGSVDGFHNVAWPRGPKIFLCTAKTLSDDRQSRTIIHEFAHTCAWRHGDSWSPPLLPGVSWWGVPNDSTPDVVPALVP